MSAPTDREATWAPPEGREGMVTVYDHDGHYRGCMGLQRWKRLLIEDGPRCDVWAPDPPTARDAAPVVVAQQTREARELAAIFLGERVVEAGREGRMTHQSERVLARTLDALAVSVSALTSERERIVTLHQQITDCVNARNYNGVRPLLDAFVAALAAASVPTESEPTPSVCSRCAGTDPDCYICAQFRPLAAPAESEPA